MIFFAGHCNLPFAVYISQITFTPWFNIVEMKLLNSVMDADDYSEIFYTEVRCMPDMHAP